MLDHLIKMLDALDGVRLLPHRAAETTVMYGFVPPTQLDEVAVRLAQQLEADHYEVHQCAWPGEIVLLVLNNTPQPLAIRLTSSPHARYDLYALSRPSTAQTLWQWAQTMVRESARHRLQWRAKPAQD